MGGWGGGGGGASGGSPSRFLLLTPSFQDDIIHGVIKFYAVLHRLHLGDKIVHQIAHQHCVYHILSKRDTDAHRCGYEHTDRVTHVDRVRYGQQNEVCEYYRQPHPDRQQNAERRGDRV